MRAKSCQQSWFQPHEVESLQYERMKSTRRETEIRGEVLNPTRGGGGNKYTNNQINITDVTKHQIWFWTAWQPEQKGKQNVCHRATEKEEIYQSFKGDNFPDAKLLKELLVHGSLYNDHERQNGQCP